jgi:hypothetical protein
LAPDLVQIYRKFEHQGVSFVSLSNEPKERVAEFCQNFCVPWPCGFGVSTATLENFKAVFPKSPRIMPTLYVIGHDGRIVWHDHHFRLRHAEDQSILQELEGELAKAVALAEPEN